MNLYERFVRVTMGQSFTHLKIAFEIEATVTGGQTRPNPGWVEIYNLNESSRNSVGNEWDHVTVEAGYLGMPGKTQVGGNVGIIGAGQIRDVEHIREKTDIRTHIEFLDGYEDIATGTVSKTIDAGTDTESIIREIVKTGFTKNVSMGDIILGDNALPRRALVLYGSAANELNKLGLSNDYHWSLQKEVFQAIGQDKYLPSTVIVGPYNGMIGVPTMTDNGIKVDVMMNPHIFPGMLIQVESDTLDMSGRGNLYKVNKVTYYGDNGIGESPGPFGLHIEGTEVSRING